MVPFVIRPPGQEEASLEAGGWMFPCPPMELWHRCGQTTHRALREATQDRKPPRPTCRPRKWKSLLVHNPIKAQSEQPRTHRGGMIHIQYSSGLE